MESIVKMGVKTARDSRNEDAVQAGQNTGPGVDRFAGESGKTAGTDYNYSSTGIPGVSYPYGAASTSGAGSAARRSNPAYGTTAGGSLDGKAADGITGKVKADGSAKAGEGTAESQKRAEKKTADSERVLMHRQRRQYRMIAAYAVATVVISYVLLHMANNLGDILKMAGKAAQTIGMLLAPLFWGFVVAYILSPAVEFFENRFQNRGLFKRNLHKRRGIAVAVTYLLAILFLGALLSIVASALSKSLRIASLEDLVIMIETLAGTLKSFQRSIQDWLVKMNLSSNEVATALSDVGESVARFTSGLSKSVTGTITQIGGLLTSSIFVIIFSIYFLLDKEGIERYWKRVVTAVGGRNARHYCKIIVEDADTVFSGYIRGQLIDALSDRDKVCCHYRDSQRNRKPHSLSRSGSGLRIDDPGQPPLRGLETHDCRPGGAFYHSDHRRKCDQSQASELQHRCSSHACHRSFDHRRRSGGLSGYAVRGSRGSISQGPV